VNRFNPRASEQSSTNFDGFAMMPSAVEERHHLIKDVVGRHNRRNVRHRLPPVLNRLIVVLII
jgi:hypothetical protein